MQRRRPSPDLRSIVLRSLAVPMFGFGIVAAYAVPSHLLAGHVVWPAPSHSTDQSIIRSTTVAPYEPQWSQRLASAHPHCVDRAAWILAHPAHTRDELMAALPASFVVVQTDGTSREMSYAAAEHRSTTPDRADDVWVVGWCS